MKVTVYFTFCPMCLSARGVCLVALTETTGEYKELALQNKTTFNRKGRQSYFAMEFTKNHPH